MATVTILSTTRDAGKVIVNANIVFDDKDFTAQEAESFVKSAISAEQSKGSSLAAIHMTDTEKKIASQLGISPRLFAKYNPA